MRRWTLLRSDDKSKQRLFPLAICTSGVEQTKRKAECRRKKRWKTKNTAAHIIITAIDTDDAVSPFRHSGNILTDVRISSLISYFMILKIMSASCVEIRTNIQEQQRKMKKKNKENKKMNTKVCKSECGCAMKHKWVSTSMRNGLFALLSDIGRMYGLPRRNILKQYLNIEFSFFCSSTFLTYFVFCAWVWITFRPITYFPGRLTRIWFVSQFKKWRNYVQEKWHN